ncbi:MAG: hypothetical protein OCC49_05875 [Fibrobacterales bacterium]
MYCIEFSELKNILVPLFIGCLLFALISCSSNVPVVVQRMEVRTPRASLDSSLIKAADLIEFDLIRTDSNEYVFRKDYGALIGESITELTLNVEEKDSSLVLTTSGDRFYGDTDIKNSGTFRNLFSYVVNDVVDQEAYLARGEKKYKESLGSKNVALGVALTMLNPGLGVVYGSAYSIHPVRSYSTAALVGLLDLPIMAGVINEPSSKATIFALVNRAWVIGFLIIPQRFRDRLEKSPYYFSIDYIDNTGRNPNRVLKGCDQRKNSNCAGTRKEIRLDSGILLKF